MTRKRKILIILLVLAFALSAISFGAVYAYNVLVRYNYNVKAETPLLSASVSEDGATLTVTNAGGAYTTKCDVILTMEGAGTLNAQAPDLRVTYSENGKERVRSVYKNLALNGSSTDFHIESASAVEILAVRPAEAAYNGETVEYRNAYVSSTQDLKLLNTQENYNNPFEFIGNALSKNTVAYAVCLIDDITLDESLTLNFPCSLDTLDRTLTLQHDLTIRHSYAGRFYLAGLKPVAISDGVTFTVIAPKGYYDVSETLGLNEQNFIGTFDYATYGDEILNDALNFAKTFIPERVCKSLLLPMQYQSFGVNLYYEFADTKIPFYGEISEKGALQRKETTERYIITITAERGGKKRVATADFRVIGTGDSAFSEVLGEVLSERIYAESEDTELLSVLVGLCAAGDFSQAFTLQISDHSALPENDENAVKFMIGGTASQTVQFIYDAANGYLTADSVKVESLFLRRGALPVAENITLTLTVNSVSTEKNFSVRQAIVEEALYYLRDSSPAFITNQPYSVLNLRADGLYLGNTKITSSKLNLTALRYSLVTSDGTTDTTVDAAAYFTLGDDGLTLSLLTDQTEIPKNLYLKYECAFSGENAPRILKQRVVQAIPGSGGENTGFESNNPFDALFLSSEVNWLEGGTFEVPPTSSSYFADIEILSVGGETYNAAKHKLCYLDYSGNEFAHAGNTYYKTIEFTTDRNYVPDSNTPVKVRCTYLESETESVVLTQDYTFTIHGIFKCGDNSELVGDKSGYTPYVFEDQTFYQMTISLLDAVYVSELSDGARLILSDSKYFQGTLDYSKLSSLAPAEGVRLDGIERLANSPSINFHGVKIADLSAFAAYEGSALKTLNLSDCALTDGILYGLDAENSWIYGLHLMNADLSANSVSRTDKLLARTVASLDLSSQKNGCLSEIGGLNNLMELTNLTLSDNAIYRFETLKNLKKLRILKIDGNRLNDPMYGTDGALNVPVYVWMIKTNAVGIYAQKDSDVALKISDGNANKFSEGGCIDTKSAAGCVALNAFAMPTKLYSQNAKTKLEADITGLNVSDYRFRFSDLNGVTDNSLTYIVNYANSSAISGTLTDGAACCYIVAATDLSGNVTAYREFSVTVYYAEVQS